MKTAIKIGGGLIAFILLVILILIGFLATFDVNQYKPDIVKIVQEQTGRNFNIEGKLHFELSLIPTIDVEGVTLGNSQWGSQPNMVSVGNFEAEVALLPLLQKKISIKRLILNDAQILLEKNEKGVGNWELQPGDVKTSPEMPATEEEDVITSLDINEIEINNATLTYIDRTSNTTEKVTINEFVVESGGFFDPMDLSLDAVYNDIPIKLSGTSGAPGALTENKKFELDIEAEVGDISSTIKGKIKNPKELQGVELTVKLEMKSLSTASKLAKKELPKVGALQLSAAITKEQDTLNITDLVLDSEIAKLDGNVSLPGVTSIDQLIALLASPMEIPAMEANLAVNLSNANKLAAFTREELPDTGPIELNAKLSKQGSGVSIEQLTGKVNTLEFMMQGKVADIQNQKGLSLQTSVSVPKLSDLNKLAGTELPKLGPLTASATASDKAGAYQLKDLKLKLANTNIAGNAVINLSGKRPAIDATLTSNLIDLAQLMPAKEEKKQENKEKVFSAEPLPFASLKAADAKLELNAKKIKTADLDLDNVKLLLSLKNGNLKLSPFAANVGGGKVTLNLGLDGSSGKSAILDTTVKATDFQPSTLPHLADKLTGGKSNIDINIAGSGASVAEIMGGANGKWLMQMGQATLKSTDDKGESKGLILMTFNNVFSGSVGKNTTTEISCGVVNADIKDGIATIDKGIAFNTNYMNIIGSGQINLKTEEIRIGIDPQARKGSGLGVGQLAELVAIKGTLANPTAGPSTTAALKTVASAGAAVMTGGLSLLAQGLLDRGLSDDDPCATALGVEKSRPKSDTRKSETSGTSDDDVEPAKESGGSIEDKIRGFFN